MYHRYKPTLIFLLFILVVLLAGGCSVPRVATLPVRSDMPSRYEGVSDTATGKVPLHQEFFASTRLRTLIDTVLARNYDLLAVAQRIRAAEAQVLQTRAVLAPQVSAVAAPGLRKFGRYTMDGAGNRSTEMKSGETVPEHLPDFFYGLQSSWEIDLWGRLRNSRKAALARFMSTLEGRQLMRAALIAETAGAYYELVAADQLIRVLDETIRLQEEALNLARVQKDAAMVNLLAVQQFEAQLTGLRAMRVEVRQQVADWEARIQQLAGSFAGPVPRDTIFFSSAIPYRLLPGDPAMLLRSRPDVRQAEWELAANQADLLAARAAFYPTLAIGAAIGVQGYRHSVLAQWPASLAYNLFGSLSAPLINRKALKGGFMRSAALQQESWQMFRKTVNRAYWEVSLEHRRLHNLSEAVGLKTTEYAQLQEAASVATELFRRGRATYLDVLFARQQGLQAGMDLIRTRKSQLLAGVQLFKALGGGAE